ncbi:MAG: LemA family protein [Flavobacteriia bacterium]|nr:MAG: LemA family protein [Flavobacteriia bacterium]
MKKFALPIILIIVAIALYGWVKGFYNKAITLKEDATKEWGNVENQYQRRFDLIDNLVATVKGYAAHEKETLEAVIKARAQATSTSIDPTNLTPEKLAEFQKAQQGLSGALNRLMVVVERYPDLKADQHFLELQSQIEGTENRINVARDRFNEAVRPYNKHIKKFPGNFLAGIFNLEEMNYFKSEAGAEKAPKVDFSK